MHIVSLVGAGGCGRIRLALRVAELADYHNQSICWVDLAWLTDSTLVPQVVAKVLNVVERSSMPLMDTLLDSLCGRPTLLILDNCKHLLAVCAQLPEALADCLDLSILARSREPLGVIGETLYPVLPLACPATSLSVGEISQIDSVRQHAQEKLKASGDWDSTRDHYLACYLRLTEEVSSKFRRPYLLLWLNWLETENDNTRVVLACVDIPVCLDDLFQRIAAINNRLELPCLDQLFEEDHCFRLFDG